MNCIKCKEEIHAARLKVLPKTKVCVNCSTAEAVSCVDVIYHKTGNTIQIMDKESADKINKLAKRSGFGIMAGMKGGSGGATKTTSLGNVAVWRVPTEEDYQRALKRVGEVEEEGLRPRTVRGYSSTPSRLTPLRGASTRSLMESPGSSSHVMALTS